MVDSYVSDTGEQDVRVSPKRTRDRVRFLTVEDLLSLEPTTPSNDPPLKELLVEGLLSFGDETRFEFGRLNILVGPNGSGKSNLIDCLRVFRHTPFDIQEAFTDSGFEDWLYRGDEDIGSSHALVQITVNVPDLPNAICHQLKLGPPVNARAQIEEVVRSLNSVTSYTAPYFIGSPRGRAVLTIQGAGNRRRERELEAGEYDPFQSILSRIRDIGIHPEITRLATLYSNFRIYSEWTFGRNSKLREATSTARSDTRLSESMDDLALALNGLEQTVAHERIRVLLRELKETYRDYVTRVLFGRVGLELLETPLAAPLPAKRLSDGTLRFLALAAILLHPAPPPLICLEEPELGMHPDMIRVVAGMIVDASTRTQLIVSTHSEYLLSALQDDFDALFAFDAGIAGSVVRRFSREEYQDWKREHTLGELWTSGELGGNRW